MKRTGIKNREKEAKRGIPSVSRTTLLFVALVVIGVIGMIIVVFFVNKETSLRFDENIYQYFLDSPVEYSSDTVISSESMNTVLRNGDSSFSVDPTPFYSQNVDTFYVPKNYCWEDVQNNIGYRIPEFSKISSNNLSAYECTIEKKTFPIDGGFMYDDSFNYIFLEAGTVTIDGIPYDVSPMSFYSQEYEMIRLFNYENNQMSTFVKEEINSDAIYTSVTGYKVKLNKGIYDAKDGGEYLLPSSPSFLKNIEERSK